MTIDSEFPAEIASRYRFETELGHGAYGTVYSGTHKSSNLKVAIKKITKVFDKQLYSKRTLRELNILKHFSSHENITSLLDVSAEDGYNELYLVQDLMEADLHQIIKSNQKITDGHFQFFLYQICRGLKYIHSANVMHRYLIVYKGI
jgi:mitogen-activated protein kinase 7